MKQIEKKNHRYTVRAAGVLMATVLLMQGCIQPSPDNTVNTTPANPTPSGNGTQGVAYVYENMEYSYRTDENRFLQHIITGKDSKYFLLANKTHPVGSSYCPDSVVTLTCPTYGGKTVELEERSANALYAMLAEMRADGVTDIYVTSGYRDYDYQQRLYNTYMNTEMSNLTTDAYDYFGADYIRKNYIDRGLTGLNRSDAEKVVLSYSAKPGTSEHQTGMCVDFVTSTAMLNQTFENTAAFTWLIRNCYRFGFILRYPSDKVDITGYKYEPWHYRFVGREAAAEIMLRGMCFEEFLELI